jgi:hypothetical protein
MSRTKSAKRNSRHLSRPENPVRTGRDLECRSAGNATFAGILILLWQNSVCCPGPIYTQTMSFYLLLRNNKESGPYSLEEIKDMSLMAYDLLWVVGKSAAWRYPGEIAELKSFAPPVPEQVTDLFRRRPNSENSGPDSSNTKKSETVSTWSGEGNSQRRNPSHLIYVNLPSEKKQAVSAATQALGESFFPPANRPEPLYDFSDLYKKKTTRTIRFSGKVLWFGTILLLFGMGILTGFFISDRRKFFSGDANHTQNDPAALPTLRNNKKVIPADFSRAGQENNAQSKDLLFADSAKANNSDTKKRTTAVRKQNSNNNQNKKDSMTSRAPLTPAFNLIDSLKLNAVTNTEMLHQQIKAHPENFVNMVTGRYSTGVFGGISSFPVTVTNNSSVKMDLVIVKVDYIQNNEKVFKTENLSFNDLEPGESVTIKAPKSPRGVKIATRLHVVNSSEIDLNYSN